MEQGSFDVLQRNGTNLHFKQHCYVVLINRPWCILVNAQLLTSPAPSLASNLGRIRFRVDLLLFAIGVVASAFEVGCLLKDGVKRSLRTFIDILSAKPIQRVREDE